MAFESVSHMQLATAEKVEERWQSMNSQLNGVISNWEHSGQGDGGFTCDDDLSGEEEDGGKNNERDFCYTKNHNQGALDQQKNFTDGRSTYLLYLWDMLEHHD